MNVLQPEILAKGREIFARMAGQKTRVFGARNLTGLLMDWSMQNEALKVQLFRLVDVLPALRSSREVASHARAYLGEDAIGLPGWVRFGVRLAPSMPWLAAWGARKGVRQVARTFILARNGSDAIPRLRRMRERPIAFTIDILGETGVSEREADVYQNRYMELIERLAKEAATWSPVGQIDQDDRGPLPKVNVSVKVSALYSQIHPADPERAMVELSKRLRPLLRRAKELGVFINFDMESTALKQLTLDLFKRLLDEGEFRDFQHAGIALQAYLRESERDLEQLIAWGRSRDRRITVRLIKGAYWDYETVMAAQREWPVPVFEHKWETDANYERLAGRMLANRQWIDCAFGTHSVRSIASCLVQAERLGVTAGGYEIQMLYGMAEPIKEALVEMGLRVREYCPVGEILPGMSYLVRRLLENTSNEGFLRATFSEKAAPSELLEDPEAIGAKERAIAGNGELLSPSEQVEPLDGERAPNRAPFANEPHTDFTIAANRRAMRDALDYVRQRLGRTYPLVIGGKAVSTTAQIISLNPARPSEIVGRVSKAGRAEAAAALAAARSAFPAWRRMPVAERAALLECAAELMREQRFELAALEVFETGKSWTESDADVAEAIDFCRFYAREMRRIASCRYVVPGETSIHHYVPRGIAVVIAPWNFPLAILCGMTTAALVTGNAVIMKPSEQSVVIGAWFMEILQRAGVPDGAINFLPGPGEEVGAYLVDHPEVDLIAFTGSREVGLKIYEAAGRTRPGQKQLKKVICEMGGKNAIIVDCDADLDEAIPGVLASAFGYQGQKCSALSRLIVLEACYDRFVARLIEAVRSLRTGLPEESGTVIGPVIDRAAFERIQSCIDIGKGEATLAFQGEVLPGDGYFIPPTIFTNVPSEARIAREEIFGPVLCIFRARDLDEALVLANDSDYGLTGGLYSRDPGNIARVAAEMEVGNLYINRGLTGALVARHPFGGFKMSGGGTKAGGPDYLQHFLFPRVVTENRMRRGFAPEE